MDAVFSVRRAFAAVLAGLTFVLPTSAFGYGQEPPIDSQSEALKVELDRLRHSRDWKDKSGRLLAKARLVRLVGYSLELQCSNGVTILVSLNRLSTADLDYVHNYLTFPFACFHWGLIMAVSEDGKYVELTLGRDDGLVTGQVFLVYRPKVFRYKWGEFDVGRPTPVGRVRVCKVSDSDRAIAEVVEGRGQIKVRDRLGDDRATSVQTSPKGLSTGRTSFSQNRGLLVSRVMLCYPRVQGKRRFAIKRTGAGRSVGVRLRQLSVTTRNRTIGCTASGGLNAF